MSDKHIGLTDQEAKNDLLNISTYVNGCADFIRQCDTPMSIAVQGDWGTGKSSFMKQVKSKFSNDENVTVIDFNTWQYSRVRVDDDRLFLPMLKVLAGKIDATYKSKHPDHNNYETYFSENGSGALKLLKTGSRILKGGLPLAGAWIGGGPVAALGTLASINEGGTNTQNSEEETDIYEAVVSTRDKLQERIDVMTGAKKVDDKGAKLFVNKEGRTGRLIIFIDDLDRLRPAAAVGLLEDMKNFMDCEGCVFVLALDHKLVQNGVKAKYGDDLDDTYARKFFEKIVQIPFYLPVNSYDIHNYVDNLLEQLSLKDKLDVNECVATIQAFTDANPRMIKRTLNAFQMSLQMKQNTSADNCQRMFALLLLQSVDEALFTAMTQKLAEEYPEMYFCKKDLLFMEQFNEEDREKISYLRSLYDLDDVILREDIFQSTMLESSHLRKADERDRVYSLICNYLRGRNFNETAVPPEKAKGSDSIEFSEKEARITVIKYPHVEHTNINFNTFKDKSRANEIIAGNQKMFKEKDGEKWYFLNGETYMEFASYLYISNIKFDRNILLIIGEIINEMLSE